jgi:Flp pilus assembly protein TadD/quercetin dioxygenase-like cupin family protein
MILFLLVLQALGLSQQIPSAERYYRLGLDLQKAGKFHEAALEFTKAVDINPEFGDAYYQRGMALFRAGKVEEAIRSFVQLTQLEPQNTHGLMALGQICVALGNLDDALAVYLWALRAGPDDASILFNLGLVYVERKEYSKAIDVLNKALAIQPSMTDARRLLSAAYKEVGDTQQAPSSQTPPASAIRVLKLSDGIPFQMGEGNSRRIVHPGMGAKRLTLNYSVSEPGHEFPQHVHDYSDDTFLVLQGQVDVRQGESRRLLLTGQAAFVPSGQIHGTITTGSDTAILISFQCPPDLVRHTGNRDSSPSGAAPPNGVITPGVVKIVDFATHNGFFVQPKMGSHRVAVAHRKLRPGEKFLTATAEEGEQLLFTWKGSLRVNSKQGVYRAGERDAVFISGSNKLEVQNDSLGETIVIQVQAPPY